MNKLNVLFAAACIGLALSGGAYAADNSSDAKYDPVAKVKNTPLSMALIRTAPEVLEGMNFVRGSWLQEGELCVASTTRGDLVCIKAADRGTVCLGAGEVVRWSERAGKVVKTHFKTGLKGFSKEDKAKVTAAAQAVVNEAAAASSDGEEETTIAG